MSGYTPRQFAIPMMMFSGLPLLVAHYTVGGGSNPPTQLCLYDQDVWKIILGLWVLMLFISSRAIGKIFLIITTLTVLAGIILSGMQIGIEQGWWINPLSDACAQAANAAGAAISLQGTLPASVMAACDPPTYVMPDVPVSLAAIDWVYSIFFLFILRTSVPI